MTVISFNNVTGSDTQASGAGPAVALTGAASAHTNGVASTVITLTNSPDLTSVLTNGTHAIWLATTSGRRLSFVTARDNVAKTVTVADSFTIPLGSAVDYAIGGKRRTLMGSSQLFTDNRGWTYVLEFTGTNYTINSQLNPTSAGFNVTGDSSTNLTVIELQHNGNGFIGSGNGGVHCSFSNIKAISTSATKTTGGFFSTSGAQLSMYNCVIGDATDRLFIGLNSTNTCQGLYMWHTAVIHCLSFGASLNGGNLQTTVNNCLFANNGNSGLEHSGVNAAIKHSVFYKNNGYGFRAIGNSGSKYINIQDCIFDSNVNAMGDSWGFPGAGTSGLYYLINNIFSNNTGAAIQTAIAVSTAKSLVFGNVYFNNGSKYALAPFTNSIIRDELDANPQFTNPAAYDFTIGNPAVRGKSYPQNVPVVPLSNFYNYGTAGAAQPQASGGGGGSYSPIDNLLIG